MAERCWVSQIDPIYQSLGNASRCIKLMLINWHEGYEAESRVVWVEIDRELTYRASASSDDAVKG